jgi:hypothetical protein
LGNKPTVTKLISMSKKSKKAGFTHQKRHSSQSEAVAKLEQAIAMLQDLRLRHNRILKPQPCAFSYDMSKGIVEKHRLIDALWACNYAHCVGSLLAENSELSQLLRSAVANTYQPHDEELFMVKQDLKLENIIATLYRTQNQQFMPIFIILRSVYAYHHGMHRVSWEFESALRLLASYKWTDELISMSIKRNPGAPFKALGFVTAACFDNFTVQVDYKSLHDLDHHGFRLDMTNWGSITIPKAAAPELNIARLLASKYAWYAACKT